MRVHPAEPRFPSLADLLPIGRHRLGLARRWEPSLDLALIFEILIDDPKSRAPAVLLRDEGLRLVAEIAALIGLQPNNAGPTVAEVHSLCRRLATAGYRLKPQPDLDGFARRRAEHARSIEAIASHLGTPTAPLLP